MSSEIIGVRRAQDGPRRRGDGARLPGPPHRPRLDLARRAHRRSSTTARQTPLNQLAGISVPEAHQIVIQPWDRGVLGAIEKAIQKSDIGLMPNVDGTVVRLNIPPLTEERRRDIVKAVHKRMEEARVEIRNLRREAADELKKEERDGDLGTDEAHRELERLQKIDRSLRSPRSTRSARTRSRRSWRSSGRVRRWPGRPTLRPSPTRPEPSAADPDDGRRRPDAAVPPEEDCRVTSRSSWTATGAGRAPAACAELEGHAAGVEAIRALLRHAVRRGVPVLTAVRVQPRELGAPGRRGRRPVRSPRGRPSGARPTGAAPAGRPGPPPRPARRAADGRPAARSARRSRRPPAATRLVLNVAFNYAGRTELVDAFRRLAASGIATGRRSTRRRSPARSTPPACPTPTS